MEGQTFYWSIMTVDDSIKSVVFKMPGFVCKRFLPFFPAPLPALLLEPLFSQSLTLVPRSFLLNRTEMLAIYMQANSNSKARIESKIQ